MMYSDSKLPMGLTIKALGLLGLLCLFATPSISQTCNDGMEATTPTSRFVLDDVYGTALDTKTGLVWKRCTEGFEWNGSGCSFITYPVVTIYTGFYYGLLRAQETATANFAGYNDWRVPTIKELSSIIERKCERPAINPEVFDIWGHIGGGYWTGISVYDTTWGYMSSTPDHLFTDTYWVVEFGAGFKYRSYEVPRLGLPPSFSSGTFDFNLRLVRGGQ